MAYTSYAPNSTFTTMCKSYSDFVDELDKLKKAKGDKNKIKELEQQLKLKGAKIKTQLDEAMVGIAANF